MKENEMPLSPDFVFEVSWEVCNKVGGIHTVISTKATEIQKKIADKLIFIGPNGSREREHPDFIEDTYLYMAWKEQALQEGLNITIGRWNIAGEPVTILIDFSSFILQKDQIFRSLWEKYQLNSLNGNWDYIEPAIFGFVAGKVIASFYQFHLTANDNVVAHFHEWMTGTGILCLLDTQPEIATVFTTHATIMGRTIAGNNLPLYDEMESYDPEKIANDFNILSKFSLEKLSAKFADGFATVSEITAKECTKFLSKKPDLVTPNGFDDAFVPKKRVFSTKRKKARNKLLEVATALFNHQVEENALLILQSGRYEYRNKGMDLFLDTLESINSLPNLPKQIIAFIMVPAHHNGPSNDLLHRLSQDGHNSPIHQQYLTHGLYDETSDPVLNKLANTNLQNKPENTVKVIFAPVYLDGKDGIFNFTYYDLLIGFDITVFPSYYEPWGYTPMESLAFSIPTLTTTVAGFGLWIKDKALDAQPGIAVVERNDHNNEEVVANMMDFVMRFVEGNEAHMKKARASAHEISRVALWEEFAAYYFEIYQMALQKTAVRNEVLKYSPEPQLRTIEITNSKINDPIWRKIYIGSQVPASLNALSEIAMNLWWSWNSEGEELFRMIDPEIWKDYEKNPVGMLDALPFRRLQELEKEVPFLHRMQDTYRKFNHYITQEKEPNDPLVAYFCMEYGLNHIIRLYSGGLGILAGDFLKEASDANKNMVAVGLFYRHGYFKQQLSLHGEQQAVYKQQKFSFLPLQPVRDEEGNWLKISVEMPIGMLYAKIWKIDVGRVPLYLMDTDIPENIEPYQLITQSLYGGDWENRLKQEFLLGVGGVKLLKKLGLSPDIYHCNEGHAAFTTLERMREYIQEDGLIFDEAIEVVKSSSLFTTHTPVPAGHDTFSEHLLKPYLFRFTSCFNTSWERIFGLGKVNQNDPYEKFSMSVLAVKLSQETNAVSKLHEEVSRNMFLPIWSGYTATELPIGHVTNGVHYATWTADLWKELYDKELGVGFAEEHAKPARWQAIYKVQDADIWEVRKKLKTRLVNFIKERLQHNWTSRHENPRKILSVVNALNADNLIIGFARRFATYKRANLLFKDLDRLKTLLNELKRPVQILFAGKAHPNDIPGQDLIKEIVKISETKDFAGKIIFLEDYEMELASYLVSGVDVWLNTPTRPLEASGTSGMKATLNGVLNLSVLDGWWAEGYKEDTGWALPLEATFERRDFQDELDSETIYRLLENEIIPTYYDIDEAAGIPRKWIKRIKNSLALIAPHFTMQRMLDEYYEKFYSNLYSRSKEIKAENFSKAKALCQWKSKMLQGWENIEVISISNHDSANKPLPFGEDFEAVIELAFDKIDLDDIGVEVVFIEKTNVLNLKDLSRVKEMEVIHKTARGAKFSCCFHLDSSGVYQYGFRVFPKHPLLVYRQDFNIMKWI